MYLCNNEQLSDSQKSDLIKLLGSLLNTIQYRNTQSRKSSNFHLWKSTSPANDSQNNLDPVRNNQHPRNTITTLNANLFSSRGFSTSWRCARGRKKTPSRETDLKTRVNKTTSPRFLVILGTADENRQKKEHSQKYQARVERREKLFRKAKRRAGETNETSYRGEKERQSIPWAKDSFGQ